MKIKNYWWLLATSCAIALFLGYFVCAFLTKPPLSAGDSGTWFGAVGTVGAIVAALLGIRAQLRHVELQAKKAAAIAQRNVVIAVLAELNVYARTIKGIDRRIENNLSAVLSKVLTTVFPRTSYRFPVFTANAAQIWSIADERLRSEVIATYAEMDMLFGLLDRNSELARQIPPDQSPPIQFMHEMRDVFRLIEKKVELLSGSLTTICQGLRAQEQQLKDEIGTYE